MWSVGNDRGTTRSQEAVNISHACIDKFDIMKLAANDDFDTVFEAYGVALLPEIVTTTAPVWRPTQYRRQAIASSLAIRVALSLTDT